MSLGHRPSIGFRCEEILKGNKGKGDLRLSLKEDVPTVGKLELRQYTILGHKPSIGFRCEEILEGNGGRGELRLSLKNDLRHFRIFDLRQ